MLAVLLLVGLRLAIGWHFLYQGIHKLKNPNFSSEPFLRQAKGPLAEHYLAMIPDYLGRERLSPVPEKPQGEGPEASASHKVTDGWQSYGRLLVSTYNYSVDQQAALDQIVAQRTGQLADYLKENRTDIDLYFKEVDRWEQWQQASDSSMPYAKKRIWDKRQELADQSSGWLKRVDEIDQACRNQLLALATAEQRGMSIPPREWTRDEVMDQLVTFGNLAIGACLLAGLLTRFACWSGGFFLLSINLSQIEWPTVYPPAPPMMGFSLGVTPLVLVMLTMFALGTTPVGRWGGLDFFVNRTLKRLFGRRSKS